MQDGNMHSPDVQADAAVPGVESLTPAEGGAVAETHASTEAHGGPAAEHHVEPAALGMTATAWVSLAMIALILIMLVKKVPAAIGGSLDKKIATIKSQLDDAARLRTEAEAIKAEYETKAKAAAQEAVAIVEGAKTEAETILAKAKQSAEELVARRGKMAEDKIAAAELAAVAEVRAKAASAAAAAASTLLAEVHTAAADKSLVDQTISSIGSSVRLN